MQGIYTYIPETNYVPMEYSVAAIMLLLFMVLISLVSVLNLLYFYIGTFRSMCAVPNMAVFCSSLTSCFLGMLLTCPIWLFSGVPWHHVFLVFGHVFSELLWNSPSRPYYYWYRLCLYIPYALFFFIIIIVIIIIGIIIIIIIIIIISIMKVRKIQ